MIGFLNINVYVFLFVRLYPPTFILICPPLRPLTVPFPESSQTDDDDEAQLYQTWFKLVLEKNRLARYESELMIL